MQSIRISVRPAWGDQGAGLLWLAAGVVTTFVFGLALQLIGVRALSEGDYATFIFGLGIGNVASAIAGAVQPVVAVRAGTDHPAFLPAMPATILAGASVSGAVVILLLGPAVGWWIAVLACLQIPLHALVGVGLGRLQASRSFSRIAGTLALWSGVRLAVVLPLVYAGRESALVFVFALPAALATELFLLARLGAYRGIDWRVSGDARRLLSGYALWGLFAWLVNADAIFARLSLSAVDADLYAVAFTLGRQPLYAVAPLTMVLLPLAASSRPGEQRERLGAILAVSALILMGMLILFGGWAPTIVELLTGDPASAGVGLVRWYAVVGSLAAAATLLLTFVFALGAAPRVRTLGLLAVVYGVVATTVVEKPNQLIIVQAIAIALLVAICTHLGLRATARRED